MIPSMSDFIYICDNAYDLPSLMAMEADIFTTTSARLHVPTAHDLLQPLLDDLGLAPRDEASQPWRVDMSGGTRLRCWCQCMLLLGQASYSVAQLEWVSLARCVATLGGLLSHGMHHIVWRRDGSSCKDRGRSRIALRERVCFLRSGEDWECLRALVDVLEVSVRDRPEMLMRTRNAVFAELHILEMGLIAQCREVADGAVAYDPEELRALLERHYSLEVCQQLGFGVEPLERDIEEERTQPQAYLRSHANRYSLIAVTCALGRQLLEEDAAGMAADAADDDDGRAAQ